MRSIIIFLLIFYFVNSEFAPIDKSKEESIKNFISKNQKESLINKTFKKSESPKVSVIISLYNAEKKILPAIRSIQNQNLQEIEIVCVNDKSNDTTLSILKELQSKDPRINIIINKYNRGTLYNKIYGALESKGEYIAFIDVEEGFANPDILKIAYETATKKYNEKIEIVNYQVCVSITGDENLKLNSVLNPNDFNKILKQPGIIDNYYKDKTNFDYSDFIFDKIYSRQLIKRISNFIGPNIWNQNIASFEDILINYAAMKTAKTIVNIQDIGYWHLLDGQNNLENKEWEIKGDRLKNPEKTSKIIDNFIIVTEKLFELTEKEPNSVEFREYHLKKLGEEKYMKAIARSIYYDRYLRLCEKFIEWDYVGKEDKRRVKKFAKNLLSFEVGSNKIFGYILDDEDDEDDGLYDL